MKLKCKQSFPNFFIIFSIIKFAIFAKKSCQIEGRSALLSLNVNKVSRIFFISKNSQFSNFVLIMKNLVKLKGDLHYLA